MYHAVQYIYWEGNCGATWASVVCTILAHSATLCGLSVRPVTAVISICNLSIGNHASLCFMYPFTIKVTKPFQDCKVASETGLAAAKQHSWKDNRLNNCSLSLNLRSHQAIAVAYQLPICVCSWTWSTSSIPCRHITSSHLYLLPAVHMCTHRNAYMLTSPMLSL